MKKTNLLVALLLALLTNMAANPQTKPAGIGDMAKWAGRYPDDKFFKQSLIKNSLRRILLKTDHDSIGEYNLMVPIKRVGEYLVVYSEIKYSDPQKSLALALNLKDGAVYVVFQRGEQRSKFSTKDNQFNLPEDVMQEIGLENE